MTNVTVVTVLLVFFLCSMRLGRSSRRIVSTHQHNQHDRHDLTTPRTREWCRTLIDTILDTALGGAARFRPRAGSWTPVNPRRGRVSSADVAESNARYPAPGGNETAPGGPPSTTRAPQGPGRAGEGPLSASRGPGETVERPPSYRPSSCSMSAVRRSQRPRARDPCVTVHSCAPAAGSVDAVGRSDRILDSGDVQNLRPRGR